MKSSSLAVTVALSATAFAAPAVAQSQPPPQPAPADTWRMPYERGFWGHAGVSFGQSKLLDESCPAGFACDDKDQAFRAFAGGRFNNIFGLEFGAMNFGKFQGGGGEIDGWGGDIAVLLGIPIGANSAIFGKAGVIYARTEVSAAAPGAASGKERGWGGRYGIAGQLGLTKEWALRADYDRYEIAAPGDHRDLETLMLGVQYTFR